MNDGIQIKIQKDGCCFAEHGTSDSSLKTDRPKEFGGQGRSFSSTDLVAVALATCTLTTLEPILTREGIDFQQVHSNVSKNLSVSPKKLASISVEISLPTSEDAVLTEKLMRAANSCVVKKSLSEDVQVAIHLLFSQKENAEP